MHNMVLRKTTAEENDILNVRREEMGITGRPTKYGHDPGVGEEREDPREGLYSIIYKGRLAGGVGIQYIKFDKEGPDTCESNKGALEKYGEVKGLMGYGGIMLKEFIHKKIWSKHYDLLWDLLPEGYLGMLPDYTLKGDENYTLEPLGGSGQYKGYKFIPKKHEISALWVGDNPLNTLAWISINSFVQRLKYPYTLYTYNLNLEVPDGVTLKDASEILPKTTIWTTKEGYNKGGVSGAFSDEFRFKLLLANGGIWVDTDLICLKYFYLNKGYLFASQQHLDKPNWGASCFIKIPRSRNRGRDVLRRCIREIAKLDKDTIYHGQIGPDLIEGVTGHMGIPKAPYYFANPISWEDCPNKLIEPGVELDSRATFLHLNNSRFYHEGVDPDKDYPGSLLQKYKDLYGSRI